MAKPQETKPFIMNLQLFADTQPAQGEPTQVQTQPIDTRTQAMAILQAANQSGQPTQTAAPQGQPPTDGNNPQNSPQSNNEGGQPTGQTPNQEPVQGQPQQQAPNAQEQLLLGKFKSPEEMANGYVNVEKAFSQKAQEAATLQQQNAALQQQMQQMQQQIQNVVNPQQQQPQPTQEEQNEQFMNSFYENPMEAIKSMFEKAVMPQIQPIQQQYQQQQEQQAWNNNVQQFAQQTPDFEQWKGQMGQVLDANPHLANLQNVPNGLEIAYNMAKGQQYQDPNAILQNQDFVKQNILGNEDIKNQIIQEYLQGLKQGEQAPTVISGQINGATPIVPENRPQNMDQAKAMAMKLMQG